MNGSGGGDGVTSLPPADTVNLPRAEPESINGGCGCGPTGGSSLWALVGGALAIVRRRRIAKR